MADSQSLKEEGNKYFQSGQFQEALKCYSQALEVDSLKDTDKAIIYKNRAACRLKLNENLAAIEDCTAALQLVDNDPKALFRRCQAHDALGNVEEAYKDVMTLMKIDPKNKAVVPIYQRLNPIVHEKMKRQTSLQSKVSQMFNLAFDPAVPIDKRTQALNNLVVLAREDAGANLICHEGGISRLTLALKENQDAVIVGAIQVLACLAKNKKRAAAVVSALDMSYVIILLGQHSAAVTAACVHLIQILFNWYAGLEDYVAAVQHCEQEKKKGERVRWPKLELSEEQQKFVDQVFQMLIKMFDSAKVIPEGRDSAMELVMKNVTYKKGLSWTPKFLDTDGIERLLTVAGTQKQFNTLAITESSRMHASVTLSTVYEDLINDKQRDRYKEKCTQFLKELFGDGIMESKIEAIEIISTLLQGPYEVGNMLLGIEGVVEIMFALAASDNMHYQRVAVEAIVHSASKKDRCSGILKDAIPILKNLYKSSDESIQVRALVGLCKLGSFAGGDVSVQPLAEGSTLYLSRICRRFLVNTTKDCDLRKWATEGLAYLTLDAEVKEELVNDTSALTSIFDLAKNLEHNMIYASVTVLVNLTNSYDKQEMIPEMVELAKFAKQHVPEEHEKDKHEFVIQRIHKLAKAGMVNALVALSNTESKNSRELICRVYVALTTEESLRGLLVQQGAVKSLLQLTENNTDVGKVLASHALAKIAVTLDPATAFPGQRIYEVVRPLIFLLHSDRSGLQNFEALLSLTNLASVSESVRNRIVKDQGLQAIERFMFEDHDMIRRAATECMCNLVMSEKVQEMLEGENDRVKMFVLFAGEEDPLLVRAASGALACISSNVKLCEKIVQVNCWLEILQQILVTDNPEIQHRACHLTMNLMSASKEIATKLVESQVLEILMAITKLEGPQMEEIRRCAQSALDIANDHGLIRPFDGQASSLEHLRKAISTKPLTITEISEEADEEEDSGEEKETEAVEKETAKDKENRDGVDVGDKEVEGLTDEAVPKEEERREEVASRVNASTAENDAGTEFSTQDKETEKDQKQATSTEDKDPRFVSHSEESQTSLSEHSDSTETT